MMINRRDFLKAVTGTTASLVLSELVLGQEGQVSRSAARWPNVLLIVSDNQRPDTIAAHGA